MSLPRVAALAFLAFALAYLAIGYYLSGLILVPAERRTTEESHRALLDRFGYDQAALLRGLPAPRDVAFAASTPGDTLRGWLYAGAADCGLVLAHGITENRANALRYAAAFEDCGCAMLLYDHRAHGASDGAYLTGGHLESDDVLAAQDFLSGETGVARSRIGFVGESWGASAALIAAAKTDSAAFVLADSPFASWRDAIAERSDVRFGRWARALLPGAFLWARLRAGAIASEASPLRYAPDVAIPALVIHSAADTITPPSHTARIGAALPAASSRAVVLEWGAWHAQNVLARPGEYRALVDSFLRAQHVPLCNP